MLRKSFKTSIGYKGTSTHLEKSTVVDIYSLVDKLISNGLIKLVDRRRERTLSIDIQQEGVDLLRPRIDDFNKAYTIYISSLTLVVEEDFLARPNTIERIEGANRRNIKDAIIDTKADEAYVLHTNRKGQTQILEGVESVDL